MDIRELNDAIARIVNEVKESVVTVVAEAPRLSLFFGHSPLKSVGSGFAVDKEYVVTNGHVVQNYPNLTVVLHNGDRLNAAVVATDYTRDLALLEIEGAVKPLKLGDSDKVRVGEIVLAIGSPLGLPGPSVSLGVISATGRTIIGEDVTLEDLIQTDAAINPGNSGGPLINLDGEAIGIATAIVPFAQGIGFAIPINTVKRFLKMLVKYGRPIRAWIGVYVAEVDRRIASLYNLPVSEGLLIARIVPGGPADYAGLDEGDIIVSVNNRKVAKTRELREIIEDNVDKRAVELEVIRGKKRFKVSVPIAVEEIG